MNNRTIYILGGILLGVLGLMLLAQLSGTRAPDAELYVFPSLRASKGGAKTEAIRQVSIEHLKDGAPQKLIFDRTDQGWKLKQPAVRVVGTMVDRLIDEVRNARKEESADLSTNLKELGLDPPELAVTLVRTDDGREFRINVGSQSAGNAENAVVYVNSSEVSAPMAVRRAQLDLAFKEIKDFLPPKLLDISVLNTSYAQFDVRNETVLAVEARGERRWYFVKPAGYGEADFEGAPEPADVPASYEPPITGVKALVGALGDLPVAPEDYVTLDASDEELARYGLAKDRYATLRLEVKRTADLHVLGSPLKEAVSETLLIGKKAEAKAGDGGGDRYYARREDEHVVVLLPGKPIVQVLAVLPKPDLLRSRDLVFLDRSKVDAIDLKTADGLVKLRRTGVPEAWRVFGVSTPSEADHTAMRDLFEALNARRQVKEFLPSKSDADYGLDKPAAVVTAWTNGIPAETGKKPEPQDPPPEPKLQGEPAVVLTFGKTNKDVVYVRKQEGKEAVVLSVPATVLTKVARGPLGFVNRTLPSFTVDQAVKLEVERDGKTFSLENQAKEGAALADWKLTTPAEDAGAADPLAVLNILHELSTLHPEKLVSEKSADVDKFGLKTPAVKATVTLRKDAKKMIYLFGKETEDKKAVYFRQADRDLIFEVGVAVLKPLRSDLKDHTVIRFETSKVKEIKLSGWKKLGKGVQTLRLLKGAQGWEVKDAPEKPFPLNAVLVDDFVSQKLARLSPEKFIVQKTGPKPMHQFDEATRNLLVEVSLDGTPAVTLTIGGLDASAMAYFAQASTRPGDIFLLPQRSYEELLKEGPAYFKNRAPAK